MKLGIAGTYRMDCNNPTGTRGLIAVDKVGGKVRLYEPGTYREMAVIEVEKLPHEVAISPNHKTAYVTIYGTGIFGNNPNPSQTIAVIDLDRGEQADTIIDSIVLAGNPPTNPKRSRNVRVRYSLNGRYVLTLTSWSGGSRDISTAAAGSRRWRSTERSIRKTEAGRCQPSRKP